jgi:Zn-dependent alcohol dehydrogenase
MRAGRIPADKLITHVLGLDQIHAALDLMWRGEALRVVLKP